jgi:hypothetical protein
MQFSMGKNYPVRRNYPGNTLSAYLLSAKISRVKISVLKVLLSTFKCPVTQLGTDPKDEESNAMFTRFSLLLVIVTVDIMYRTLPDPTLALNDLEDIIESVFHIVKSVLDLLNMLGLM